MRRTNGITVYEPGGSRWPDIPHHLREVWARRRFAYYMARADLKARHYDTWFGQLWTVLNPLMLALIYYMIVAVIFEARDQGPETVAAILAGLYAFYYTRNALAGGAASVVGGGALILNTSMPRAVLPLSSLVSAFMLYIPTLFVYAAFHLYAGLPITSSLLWLPVLLLIHTSFNMGAALLLATANVYFRDVASFLPYTLRVWLYLSPVLYEVEDVPEVGDMSWISTLLYWANPMFSLIGAWKQVVLEGVAPAAGPMWLASGWAFVTLVGGALIFMRKEGEFAVRV